MLNKNPARRPDIKYVCHELKVLEKEGQCWRINPDAAKSVGELLLSKTQMRLNKTGQATQSCKVANPGVLSRPLIF